MRGGDSRAPLTRFLAIGEDARVLLREAPDAFVEQLLEPGDQFQLVRSLQPGAEFDVIVAFAAAPAALRGLLDQLPEHLCAAGALWIAWPVGRGAREESLNFDAVRRSAIETGLVDTKSGPVGAAWRGIRFILRSR